MVFIFPIHAVKLQGMNNFPVCPVILIITCYNTSYLSPTPISRSGKVNPRTVRGANDVMAGIQDAVSGTGQADHYPNRDHLLRSPDAHGSGHLSWHDG